MAMSSTAIRRAKLRLYRRAATEPRQAVGGPRSPQQDQNLGGGVNHQGGGKNRGKKRHPDTEGALAMPIDVPLYGPYHRFACQLLGTFVANNI
jgi:hypothetical protein